MSARGNDDRLGVEGVHFAIREVHRDDADGFSTLDEQVEHLVFIEKIDFVFQALLVQRLQDHVTRAVRGVRRASDGFPRLVVGVPAERSLGDLAVGGAVEGQSHVFQFQHRLGALPRT